MYCHEGIEVPLERLHDRNLQRMYGFIKLPRALPEKGIGKYLIDLVDRIKEFCRRDLAYDSDVLRAFQGILREFKNYKGLDAELCGLPIFNPCVYSDRRECSDRTPTDRMVEALAWRTKKREAGEESIKRRREFPSWTWAGWKGRYDFLDNNCFPRQGKLLEDSKSVAKFILDFGGGDMLDCENETNHIIQ
jgi:hypothetical protein